MAGMAVTATPKKLDAHAVRADFPIFEQEIHGKPLAFLDSAASAQKPRQMMEAMTTFYSTSYANVHRGVYVLAERATAALEGAREKVRVLLNAPDVREIIFVRDATEAAPHLTVDVQALGADFVAISAHKMCGPSACTSTVRCGADCAA